MPECKARKTHDMRTIESIVLGAIITLSVLLVWSQIDGYYRRRSRPEHIWVVIDPATMTLVGLTNLSSKTVADFSWKYSDGMANIQFTVK